MQKQLQPEQGHYHITFQNQQSGRMTLRQTQQAQPTAPHKVTLTKAILHRLTTRELRVEMSLNSNDQVQQLFCSGHLWDNLMMTLILISRTRPLHLADVQESVECYSSLWDQVEIYQTQTEPAVPRL